MQHSLNFLNLLKEKSYIIPVARKVSFKGLQLKFLQSEACLKYLFDRKHIPINQ